MINQVADRFNALSSFLRCSAPVTACEIPPRRVRMRLFSAVIFSAAAMLAGCAAGPEKVVKTASGMPEIVIASMDRAAIRDNILARNLERGWALERESESLLLFTQTDESGSAQSVITQVLIGNANSTPPQHEIRYTLARVNGGTKVSANISISTQMPGGQVRRHTLNDHAPSFNAVQAQLQRVKLEIEAPRAPRP